jgi:superfamily II DNA or RNA helicase
VEKNMAYTIPNLITFDEWLYLKHYGQITKGYEKFTPEELDESVVFYDENRDYLDYLERKQIEDIRPEYVLVPRFFWEINLERIPAEYCPSLELDERMQELDELYKSYWISLQNNAVTETWHLKSEAEPREEQSEPLNFLLNEMQEKHRLRGILQAPPGAGKTFMSIKTISNFRAKALIIVPNEVLQDQWVEAILQFSNLTEDQIGIIQGSDLDKSQIEIDKPVTIIKIQSLFSQIKRNKLYDLMNFYKYCDMVFYDECHTSGAATSYSKTSSLFMTPNIIGLTATPYRTGVNDYLLKSSIGETLYKLEHNNLTPSIEIHNVYTEFSPNEIKRLRSIGQDYVMFLGMFNAMMKSKNQYFEYLADIVAWNHSQGHNLVVLFSTIALMEKLQNEINKRHPSISDKVLLLKGKTKQDAMDMVKEARKEIMVEYKKYKEELDELVKAKELKRKEAQVKIKERRAEIDARIEYLKEHALDLYKQKVRESEIIVSNYNLLSAGFDKSQLSNIIFGGAPRIGKISVIQSIGRITRIHEGKLKPLVQYFIPSFFIDSKTSTSIILTNNIKVQYPDAKFKYVGFQ